MNRNGLFGLVPLAIPLLQNIAYFLTLLLGAAAFGVSVKGMLGFAGRKG